MEELAILPHLGAEDLVKFAPTLLSSAYLECYIAGLYHFLFRLDYLTDHKLLALMVNYSGNIERNESETMIEHIEDMFFKGTNPISRPLYPSQHPTNRVVKLERGIGYFYSAEGLNPNDENSALVHYIQVIN